MVALGLDDAAGGVAVADDAADQVARDGRGRRGRRSPARAGSSTAIAARRRPRRAPGRAARARARAPCRPAETFDSSQPPLDQRVADRSSSSCGATSATSAGSSSDSCLPCSIALRTSPATIPCDSRNGSPGGRARRRRRWRPGTRRPPRPPSRSRRNSIAARASRRPPASRQLERVDRVEQVLLVLLEVLVVGQRRARAAPRGARSGGRRSRGALARSSSATSGFFFCGMMLEPDAHASDDLAEAELLASTTARSRRRAATGGSRRWRRPTGSRARSRGSRPRRSSWATRALKPSSSRHGVAVGVEVDARERTGAERQLVAPPRVTKPKRSRSRLNFHSQASRWCDR